MLKWLAVLLFFFHINSALAFCFEEAGKYFDINPKLLIAIAFAESKLNPEAINYNRDANNQILSTDHGLMQINSWWFDYFNKKGIDQKEIKLEPCLNVFIGAYILQHNFTLLGRSWHAVGVYNTGFRHTPKINKIRADYIQLVQANFEILENE